MGKTATSDVVWRVGNQWEKRSQSSYMYWNARIIMDVIRTSDVIMAEGEGSGRHKMSTIPVLRKGPTDESWIETGSKVRARVNLDR